MPLTVEVTDEVLLPVNAAGSLGSLTVTVLVTLGMAVLAAVTTTVTALALVPPAAMAVALVHFTSLPPTVLMRERRRCRSSRYPRARC